MARFGYRRNLAVKRSHYFPGFRFNANAISQNAGRKRLIRNAFSWNHISLNRSINYFFHMYRLRRSCCRLPCSNCILRLFLRLRLFVLISKHPCQYKRNAYGNCHHQNILNRHIQTEQNTKQTRYTCSAGAKLYNRSKESAARAADAAADKGLKIPQIHTKNRRLRNSHKCAERRRKRHGFCSCILCFYRNCKRRRSLCEICRRRQRQPICNPVLCKLSNINDGIHVMDSGNNRRRIKRAHNKAANPKRKRNQPLNAVNNAIFNHNKQRSNHRIRQITRYKYAHQRRHE